MLSMGVLAMATGDLWIKLGAIVAAAAGLAVLLKRRQSTGSRPQSIPLTHQHAVHVVQIPGARLVVGTGPGAAPTLLCELAPDPPLPAADITAVIPHPAVPSGNPDPAHGPVQYRPSGLRSV